MTAQMTLPATRYADAPAMRAFWQRLLERTRAIPGVTSAGLISTLPFSGSLSAGSFTIVGRTLPRTATPPHALNDRAGGDYFRAMGIPLLEGRSVRGRRHRERPPRGRRSIACWPTRTFLARAPSATRSTSAASGTTPSSAWSAP